MNFFVEIGRDFCSSLVAVGKTLLRNNSLIETAREGILRMYSMMIGGLEAVLLNSDEGAKLARSIEIAFDDLKATNTPLTRLDAKRTLALPHAYATPNRSR